MVSENGEAAETAVETVQGSMTRGNLSEIRDLLIESAERDGASIDDDGNLRRTEPAPKPAETPAVDPLKSTAEILAEQESEQPETPVADPETPAPAKVKVTSLKELAEAAGIDMTALYDLTLGFRTGADPVKLGEVKDAFQSGLDLGDREQQLTDERESFQNEQLVSNRALDSLMSQLQITPELLERARSDFNGVVAREQKKLFEVMPELGQDVEKRKQAMTDIVQLVKPYGISGVEIANLADHRFYKLALDAAGWKARIDAARAEGKRLREGVKGRNVSRRNVSRGRGHSSADKLTERAKQTGLRGDQIAAVSALLTQAETAK